MTHSRHPSGAKRATVFLERLHADLVGSPALVPSIKGERYFLMVMDEGTGYMFPRAMKLKQQSAKELRTLLAELQNQKLFQCINV